MAAHVTHLISSDSEDDTQGMATRIKSKFTYEVSESVCVNHEKVVLPSGSSNNEIANADKLVKTKAITKNEDRIKAKEVKRILQERKRLEKEQLKLEKQQEKLVKNAVKPGECIKFMVAYIDRHLLELTEGSEIISRLSANSIEFKVMDQEISCAITFFRLNAVTKEESRENESLIIIPVEDFISLVYNQIYGNSQIDSTICTKCKAWKKSLGQNITLMVCGLDEYHKEQKTLKQRNYRQTVLEGADVPSKRKKRIKNDLEDSSRMRVSRVDVETALIAAQIEENINSRLFATPAKVADFVSQVVKSIAERPFKQEKTSSDQFNWYAEGSNVNCVKIDKSGIGLLKLWHQQLRQFNNVGIEVAQAIAKAYPSPNLLWQAYAKLPEHDGLLMLSDLPVRRGTGILANTRKIGPELSKKIYRFMTSTEPSQNLGQKT